MTTDTAKDQAMIQYATILQLVNALELDWDRLDYLQNEENLGDEERAELVELTVQAGEFTDREDAESAIQESALSVEVRSGWANSPEDFQAEEFRIVLCIDGPHVEILGELRGGEPHRAWVQYTDWGTSPTQLFEASENKLLTFCQQLYFGE